MAATRWPELVAGLAAAAREHRAVLAVVDTFAHWTQLGGDQEKDAGHVQRALGHVHALAREGCAVLLVHHTRKGGGEQGEAVRGSSALLGAVDASIELERPANAPNGRRQIVYLGRWSDAPPVLLVDRAGDTTWSVVGTAGDRRQAADSQLPTMILDVVEEQSGLTREQLYQAVRDKGYQGRNDVLGPAVKQLVDNGHVTRLGAGKKGDPHRFHLGAGEGDPEPDPGAFPAHLQPGMGIPTAPTPFPIPTASPVGDRGWETSGTIEEVAT